MGIEYPGYGINTSRGAATESKLNKDILVVYTWVRHVLKWPEENILLFGFSIGTGVCVCVCSLVEFQ